MNLPTFDEAEASVKSGEYDGVALLIYNNEPAGRDDAKLFRDQVAYALNRVIEMGRYDSQLKYINNEA